MSRMRGVLRGTWAFTRSVGADVWGWIVEDVSAGVRGVGIALRELAGCLGWMVGGAVVLWTVVALFAAFGAPAWVGLVTAAVVWFGFVSDPEPT